MGSGKKLDFDETIGNTCDFTAVLQHLRGDQAQADASALLGIWNK